MGCIWLSHYMVCYRKWTAMGYHSYFPSSLLGSTDAGG